MTQSTNFQIFQLKTQNIFKVLKTYPKVLNIRKFFGQIYSKFIDIYHYLSQS
jgi:hypothetical protein